jgi:GNAT superfamily N-acetyltransferase
MLVAVTNEFPVGQVWVDLTKPGREGVGLLWALRVYPFMNGLGIGRMLMEAAEAELARRGYHTVELGVEQHPDVHAFYQRLGYTAVRDEVDVVRYTHPDGHEVTDMFDLRIYAKSLPQPARSTTAVAS